MKKANPSAEQHNVNEFKKLIKDFLSFNDIEHVQEVLMNSLADTVANEEHDANHRKSTTIVIGDVITFMTKLKTRYEFLPASHKEVCYA